MSCNDDLTNLVLILKESEEGNLVKKIEEKFNGNETREATQWPCYQRFLEHVSYPRYLVIALVEDTDRRPEHKSCIIEVSCWGCAKVDIIIAPRFLRCWPPCKRGSTQTEEERKKEERNERLLKELACLLSEELSQELASRKFVMEESLDTPICYWLQGFLMAYGYTLEKRRS